MEHVTTVVLCVWAVGQMEAFSYKEKNTSPAKFCTNTFNKLIDSYPKLKVLVVRRHLNKCKLFRTCPELPYRYQQRWFFLGHNKLQNNYINKYLPWEIGRIWKKILNL